MTRDASLNLVDLACNEFSAALLSLPTLTRRIRITCTDVEAATDALGWDFKPEFALNCDRGDTVSATDLESVWTETLRTSQHCCETPLSVVLLNSTSWRSSNSASTVLHGPNVTKVEISMSELPDGLKEFVFQLEQVYSEKESKLTKTEAVDALRSSQHLSVVFPHVLRHFINKIRKEARKRNVSEYLDVIDAIGTNPWYTVSTPGEFNIVLNCLLTCILDVNFYGGETCLAVRHKAIDILCSLLVFKIGKFHSVQLVKTIFQDMLFPFVDKVMNIKPEDRTSGILAGFVAGVAALARLSAAFSVTDDQLSSLTKRMEAFLARETKKNPSGSEWTLLIRAQLDNLIS